MKLLLLSVEVKYPNKYELYKYETSLWFVFVYDQPKPSLLTITTFLCFNKLELALLVYINAFIFQLQ